MQKISELLGDQRIAGSLLLICVGAIVGLHSWASYPIGTVQRMGPGMFPLALSLTLVALGVLIGALALRESTRIEIPRPAWWPALKVLGGVLAFALAVKPFGMIPAIVLLTVIASNAGQKVSYVRIILLAFTLCVIVIVVFLLGLAMQFELFRWGI